MENDMNNQDTSNQTLSSGWSQSSDPDPGKMTSKGSLPLGVSSQVRKAWEEQLMKGFAYNDQMFKSILNAFMQPYLTTILMYKILFGVGIGLFVMAVLFSALAQQAVFGLFFGGLGVAVFLAFFVSQPLHALEENLEFITWLGGIYNTYWARLLEIRDNATALAQLKETADAYDQSMERLITKHAEMRGKRPVSNPSALREALAAAQPSSSLVP